MPSPGLSPIIAVVLLAIASMQLCLPVQEAGLSMRRLLHQLVTVHVCKLARQLELGEALSKNEADRRHMKAMICN